jgi:hypothetical protein
MKPSFAVANCGSSVSTSHIDVLELADLLAVAIDEHLAMPRGYVPLGILLLGHYLDLSAAGARRVAATW